jgi:hypothetical protein
MGHANSTSLMSSPMTFRSSRARPFNQSRTGLAPGISPIENGREAFQGLHRRTASFLIRSGQALSYRSSTSIAVDREFPGVTHLQLCSRYDEVVTGFTVEARVQLKSSLLEFATRDSRLSGAAVTGSAAAGREDRWSDIRSCVRCGRSGACGRGALGLLGLHVRSGSPSSP